MRLMIAGASGQLGSALSYLFKNAALPLFEGDLPHLDITERSSLETAMDAFAPDIIVNAAAYTQVDQAEIDVEKAFSINRDGPALLADICKERGTPLIHISTDYVFDGAKGQPYLESDPVSPIGVYGKSKEAGESEIRKRLPAHVIIRTSWLYGIHGGNFVKTMIKLGRERESIRVVMDQKGSPTCAEDLAEAIFLVAMKIYRSEGVAWGTYHYCNAGVISWYEFARKIIAISESYGAFMRVREILPIPTSEYPTRAARPLFSALNCDKIITHFNVWQRPWEDSLDRTLRHLLRPVPDQAA